MIFQKYDEIDQLIDFHFLSRLKQNLQEADPTKDFKVSEWWTQVCGSYLWTDAFEKTVKETGYEKLDHFWKNELDNSFEIDDYFDYFCIKAEKLGISQSQPDFYDQFEIE